MFRIGRREAATLLNAIAAHVEVETAPDSLLRDSDDPESIKGRFERLIRDAQNKICSAVEEEDGEAKFKEDTWTREGGGGGITRVLNQGKVWEKAGVNVSVVYGTMPAEAYRAARAADIKSNGASSTPVPFFAAGISSVMHPWNPHCPTMHFNYRYFETADWNGVPGQWWFGGGTDITPCYVVEHDMKHFHGTYKAICDKHDPGYWPRFKKWCDEYFLIKHRNETRGLGGIFFDDFNEKSLEEHFAFSSDCLYSVPDAYLPIINKHKGDEYTEQQKMWQQLRRGRYVEFNLVYDRGTTFGLKTAARIESVLMSLPLTARWEYCHEPEAGSGEAKLLECTRNPKEWV